MKKVLLIDDDLGGILSYLMEDLKFYGFTVTAINKSEDVLECLKANQFHAIILDIMMPMPEAWSLDEQRRSELGLSTGLILFEKIRLEFSEMPILIYTAKHNVEINNKYTFTLRKPELSSEIVERINKMIDNEI
jgi:DNA-binding response OmpR family regulator